MWDKNKIVQLRINDGEVDWAQKVKSMSVNWIKAKRI
jgi:hypothetical protein